MEEFPSAKSHCKLGVLLPTLLKCTVSGTQPLVLGKAFTFTSVPVRLKAIFNPSKLQLVLALVGDQTPGVVGVREFPRQAAQIASYITPRLSNRLVPPSTCSIAPAPPK